MPKGPMLAPARAELHGQPAPWAPVDISSGLIEYHGDRPDHPYVEEVLPRNPAEVRREMALMLYDMSLGAPQER